MRNMKTLGRALGVAVVALSFSGTVKAGSMGPECKTPVPEIDPGSAAGALTLLVGGVLSLADRRRSK